MLDPQWHARVNGQARLCSIHGAGDSRLPDVSHSSATHVRPIGGPTCDRRVRDGQPPRRAVATRGVATLRDSQPRRRLRQLGAPPGDEGVAPPLQRDHERPRRKAPEGRGVTSSSRARARRGGSGMTASSAPLPRTVTMRWSRSTPKSSISIEHASETRRRRVQVVACRGGRPAVAQVSAGMAGRAAATKVPRNSGAILPGTPGSKQTASERERPRQNWWGRSRLPGGGICQPYWTDSRIGRATTVRVSGLSQGRGRGGASSLTGSVGAQFGRTGRASGALEFGLLKGFALETRHGLRASGHRMLGPT